MKVAILNDTHAGARNSSDLFMHYQERFYRDVFFPYLLENGITEIIHLGDYYENRKYINFKALNHNRKIFLEKLREYGIHMTIIPGNHDVMYKNTNEVCAIKELHGYYTDCVDVIMEPTDITFAGFTLGLIPWINQSNYDDTIDFLDNRTRASWIGGHLELSGFEMNKGVVQSHGMSAGLFKRFEQVITGHYHTKSSNGNITYLGSQMEFNWSDCEDSKFFHVLDTETRELEPVRNPITLFDRIVYDDIENDYNEYDATDHTNKFIKLIVKNKTDMRMYDSFVENLVLASCHDLKIIETFN